MGIELATTGTMSTRRPEEEATMLKAIKAGDWPFRKTERRAMDLWAEFTDAEKLADLPEFPDREAVDKLLINVIKLANT
jgi:hypothetical protein